jgi:putative oxidoreductase
MEAEMDDIGLVLIRATTGAFMAYHGLPKWREDSQHAKMFEDLGFHPGAAFVRQAAVVETSAAVLIALGLFGPLGPMLLLSDMIVAAVSGAALEHPITPSKHELEALYGSIAALLLLSGPGSLSLDRAAGIDRLNKRWLRWLALGAAVAGAASMLSRRNHQPSSAA